MSTPPLGWIPPSQRTQEQQYAHARAMANLRNFALPYVEPPKGTKVILTSFWSHPDCVADMGREFTGFYQFTGSCVGVSEGNCVVTAGCVQRVIGEKPTKAAIIWWPFPYGRTRYNEGDRGQGEGAVDSVMGDTLVKEGFFDITQPGLPAFNVGTDGFQLSRSIELQWSDGARIDQKWKDLAKPQAGLTKTVLNSVEDIFASIINGYPVLDGCSMFVGHGSIKGSGDNAYVAGHYDGRGGHSTCFLGYMNHPSDGPMGLYSNQWPTSTYPRDPAGGGRCCVWLTAAEIAKLFRMGGDRGETMSLSNVPGQPAQPKLLDYVY